jgi:exodeoxyribonuclease VII small subunit
MKNLTFEEAQSRIQEILHQIDTGKVSLSQVESLLNEAKELIDYSLSQITSVEQSLVQWENNVQEDNNP